MGTREGKRPLAAAGQLEPKGQRPHLAAFAAWSSRQGWKNPVKKNKKKQAQWIFLGFLVFWGFFWVFFHIFAQKREFLGFSSFKNTFTCIQTLNYNHSY
jgi:hypothetical protein